MERGLEAHGYARVARVESDEVVAFSMRSDEGATIVRIVTERGLVLSVDAPTESLERSEVSLEQAPVDLDGDGRPEVVVGATDAARERRCLALVRVALDGSLREVTPTLELGGDACVEAIRDLGDGRPVAIAIVRYAHLAVGRPPTLPVPFGPGAREEGGAIWSIVTDGVARAFFRDARRERVSELVRAREARDGTAAYRLGVELAALAWLTGESKATQRQALAAALDGLEVGAGIASARQRAEAWIAAEWREDPSHGEGDESDESDEGDERIDPELNPAE